MIEQVILFNLRVSVLLSLQLRIPMLDLVNCLGAHARVDDIMAQ